MRGRAWRWIVAALGSTAMMFGCSGKPGTAGSAAGTSGPSLDAASAEERAAAAREAAKKFGTKP